MLLKIQRDLLMDFFAVEGEFPEVVLNHAVEGQEDTLQTLYEAVQVDRNGSYTDTIISFEPFDLPIKVLLLRLAISQNNDEFLETLDKIYHLYYTQENNISLIEVLRSLKLINDIRHDTQVIYGEYGSRSVIDHYFNGIGSLINKQEVIDAIQHIIKRSVEIITIEVIEQIEPQITEKEQLLRTSEKNTAWRLQAANLTYHQLPTLSNVSDDSVSDFFGIFEQIDNDAIVVLTTNPFNAISREQAIELINDLSQDKIKAICDIARKIGFQPGMREVFLNFQDEFNEDHAKALTALVTNDHHRVALDVAIEIIRNLSDTQLLAITEVSDAIGAIENIGNLLRSSSLQHFEESHKKAFVQLVINNHNRIGVEEALNVISDLHYPELNTIYLAAFKAGSNLAMELANYFKSLQAESSSAEFRRHFTEYHSHALIAYLTNNIVTLPVDAAFKEIMKFGYHRYTAHRDAYYAQQKLIALTQIVQSFGAVNDLAYYLSGWGAPFEEHHRNMLIALMTNEINRFADPKSALNLIFAITCTCNISQSQGVSTLIAEYFEILNTLVLSRDFTPVINLILEENSNITFADAQCEFFAKMFGKVRTNICMTSERVFNIISELSDEQLHAVYKGQTRLFTAPFFDPKRQLENDTHTETNKRQRHDHDDEEDGANNNLGL